ncbi:MAG: hypothetical protein FJX25_11710 [Alphaproteobacteria bacterium]|nr:hypothetical protein [Alphaproteobacteria bacterium]
MTFTFIDGTTFTTGDLRAPGGGAATPDVAPTPGTAPTITPASGPVGTVYTITPGTYGGTITSFVGTLTQAGTSVVTRTNGNSFTFTSTAAGTLAWSETATNGTASAASRTASATITAVTPVDVAPTAGAAPTITPASGPVGTVFTVTPGAYSGTVTSFAGTLTQAGATVATRTTTAQFIFTSTAEGTLAWSETATNGTASAPARAATATITAASVTPITPTWTALPNHVLTAGSSNVVVPLDSYATNAVSYSVSTTGQGVTVSGSNLTIAPTAERAATTCTVTATSSTGHTATRTFTSQASPALIFFTDFESGTDAGNAGWDTSASIVTSPTMDGTYAARVGGGAAGFGFQWSLGTARTTFYHRAKVRLHVTTDPTTTTWAKLIRFGYHNGTDQVWPIILNHVLRADGTSGLNVWNAPAATTIVATANVARATVLDVEVRVTVAATGGRIVVRVDGTILIDHTGNAETVALDRVNYLAFVTPTNGAVFAHVFDSLTASKANDPHYHTTYMALAFVPRTTVCVPCPPMYRPPIFATRLRRRTSTPSLPAPWTTCGSSA